MPLPTFAPPAAPSLRTQHSPEISLNEAAFGDGYSQSSPRGLNHIRNMITLRWDGLAPEEMVTIRAFFEHLGGWQAFLYQPHGMPAPLKWTCKEWSAVASAPRSFTAKLRHSFT
ncbi:phage tail protein [Sulfitobacter sp.]|uniref:phage tail protein n=1 Tax=Sulfitobacter sp. TaxID=1903071 RepID=UPI003002F14C